MVSLRHQLELEGIFIILFIGLGSLYFALNSSNSFQFFNNSNFSAGTVTSPLSTNPEKEPEKLEYSQVSPDGSIRVIMKVAKAKDTVDYSFYTQHKADEIEKLIYEENVSRDEIFEIPYNTWSPDNKYFFIKKTLGNDINIVVFSQDGSNFPENEKFLNLNTEFEKQNTVFTFDKATGWGAESLIVFNTKDENGDQGASFWFEIPSKSIIQLSTKF